MLKVCLVLMVLLTALTVSANPKLSLNSANTIVFRGEVNATSVSDAMDKIAELNKKRGSATYPLYLVLDTPGGSIDAGFAFLQYAKTIKNLHTVTLFAASMGSAFVQALPGNRYITDDATLMFHRARGGVQGQIGEGELESQLAYFKRMVTFLEQTNADRMKMPLLDYRKAVKDELWIFGSDNISANSADAVVNIICSQELIDLKENKEFTFLVFTIKLQFSGCPLFRIPKMANDKETKDAFIKNYVELKRKFSPGIL